MADDSDPRPADAEGPTNAGDESEPMRFRVADTGWPPPPGSAGSALPRRTPGASGGPGSTSAPGGTPEQEEPPPEPADVRSGWVTSPPLDDEPWAGLPDAAEGAADASTAPGAGPAPEVAPAAAAPDPDGKPDAGTDVAAETTRSSGRHRGPKSRHGRPRRGRRHRGETVVEPSDSNGPRAVAEAVAVGTEPEAVRSHSGRAKSRRTALSWQGARLVALVAAVVAALVFGVLNLVTRVWPGPPGNPYTSSSTRAAIAAATAVAAPILSYDYKTIDEKAGQLAPLQTATCATQYQQLLTTTVKPLAVQNKATQKGTVLAAGVSAASAKAVTVLAFVQLTSTNSVKKGTAINEAQISVSMVKQHGKWLLAGTSANGAGNGGTPSCGGANPAGK